MRWESGEERVVGGDGRDIRLEIFVFVELKLV